MIIYDVKPGDNLWSLSQRFGVPMQSIISTNGITQPNNLVIGMDLVIPVDSFLYIVRSGDSLWSIGQKFNVDYRNIASFNNLKYPYSLFVGQKLQIPVKNVNYTVRYGDSLWSISQRFNTTASQIIALNGLQYPYLIYPGQNLVIYDSQKQKPVIETLGYYRPTTEQANLFMIDTLGPYLTYLGVFDFPITSSGEILGELDPDMLKAAREKGVMALPVLTNLRFGSFSPELARDVLSDTANLNNLISNIVALLEKYDLGGIIIDFENLYPADRNLFTRFIRQLSQALRDRNKILIVNLAPKWGDWPDRDWAGFFDYNAIGEYIDIAAIMTYEWGWREGPPRPTAPIDYVKRSLDYAIANGIPANKILMGMTLYGYDWELPNTPENVATTVTLPHVWDRGIKYNARIHFDDEAKQPYMNYIDYNNSQHRIWFENALSHYYKYELVKEYGLRGTFYWLINQPFPSTWYMISNLFKVRHLL
ncbi:LysM peptidoglycan-binding domain-containing protein [Wukongibacter baidiensis]|uniref:LysM peptidoglycan-binding domain-containing protein n=1 Tax=Wukongibacter baidiensis TaxID=1723361 RepID=UPI003D7F5496